MGAVKKRIKALLGLVVFATGLHRLALRNRAVIVAFHRISDSSAGASLNCSPAMFARFCEFFEKYFTVTPLAELLASLQRKEPIGSKLVITFDDGYKDNFEVAAPLLKQRELPATFFVATDFIGSRTIPFWDAEDGFASSWMGWDDVEALHEMGFDIGGHTLSHANLGEVDLGEARKEVLGCRESLEGALRVPIRHFAYPFGGPRHIRPDTREAVATAGFECCLSCHGGVVSPDDDPFHLRREPINTWSVSPYQYGFELLMRVVEART